MAARRRRRGSSTIGESPLDAVVPRPSRPVGEEAKEPATTTAEPGRRALGGRKERLTVHLPVELIDRVKNAVYWTPGMTLTAMGERAFRAELERLEGVRGEPYPPREEELRGGRPMK